MSIKMVLLCWVDWLFFVPLVANAFFLLLCCCVGFSSCYLSSTRLSSLDHLGAVECWHYLDSLGLIFFSIIERSSPFYSGYFEMS